jgi:hypothetical protein
VSPDPSPRPLVQLPVAGGPPADPPPRHETVLPDEPADALDELHTALAVDVADERRSGLLRVAARHPALLEVWARLSEDALSAGDPATAYAYARVAYHRGLDRLRRHGWGGTGLVRWAQPSNRGFLRGLRALLAAAAAIDEEDEATRCRAFLLELDPDDGLGAAAYPAVPRPGWKPPPIP